MGEAGEATPALIPSAFLDASVLIPAAISPRGSSRDIIEAGERGQVRLIVNQDVLDEAERNLYRKAPQALRTFWAQREQFEQVAPTSMRRRGARSAGRVSRRAPRAPHALP